MVRNIALADQLQAEARETNRLFELAEARYNKTVRRVLILMSICFIITVTCACVGLEGAQLNIIGGVSTAFGLIGIASVIITGHISARALRSCVEAQGRARQVTR